MKILQIILGAVLIVFTFGLSASVSQADEIEELKKRLKFLEAQKEIVKKLDSMQLKIDGFQKEIDNFRVQYDLKTSKKDIKKKDTKKKDTKTQALAIVKFSWEADVCNQAFVPVTVTADLSKLKISAFIHTVNRAYKGKLVGGGDENSYQFDIKVTSTRGAPLDYIGTFTPSGGTAKIWAPSAQCGGEAKLVRIKE